MSVSYAMVDNSDDVLGYADANHVVLIDYFTQMLIFIEKGGINVSLIISFKKITLIVIHVSCENIGVMPYLHECVPHPPVFPFQVFLFFV